MKKLRIAMTSLPWLKIPPEGYGGIEYIVHYLAIELQKMGHEVELFSTKDTTTPVTKNHWYYADGQYRHIHKMLYESVTLPITQVLFALRHIRDGNFDIIHDHNGFLGPAIMSDLNPKHYPPVLHTLHGPFSTDDMVAKGMPDNRPMYMQFQPDSNLYFNGISNAQMKNAPKQLDPMVLGVVHNSLNIEDFTYYDGPRDDYFVMIGRINRDKGVAVAAGICEELGEKLKIAGIVDGISDPRRLLVELASESSSHRTHPDFVYYRDQLLPHLIPRQIEYIGEISGEPKTKLLGRAKALLFPIDWEEPFGMSVIDAMACGTPVVAMNRGSMPELIEHGVNGFLANNEKEFKEYMTRVSEIDPAACRRSVEEHFSAKVMAEQYVERYLEAIAKSK